MAQNQETGYGPSLCVTSIAHHPKNWCCSA